MKLALPNLSVIGLWNRTLLSRLQSSSRFQEVSDIEQPQPRTRVRRSPCFCVFSIDGARIGLDTWDTPTPLSDYVRAGEFAHGGVFADLQLIIKIQFYPSPHWTELQSLCPIPIVSWVAFPTSVFPLSSFSWEFREHRFLASAAGKMRRRHHWINHLLRIDRIKHDVVPLPMYLDVLKECDWGLILVGKTAGGDGKNRREPEFMSCGMPLALNYRPHYPFPYKAGEHFVLLDRPEALHTLDEIDPRPFASASCSIWEKYYTPNGMADLLLTLLEQGS